MLVRTEGDEKGVAMPKLTVKMDGSWSKAGFTSNFGFAVVLSTRTGKVLDYEFLSKYCGKCNMAKGAQTGDDPQPCENCRANYEGSSGGMEAAGVKRMFERSRQWAEGGVVYGGVVRDRDSDVMFSIRFIYNDLSLCSTCTRLKDTDAKSPEWKKFVGTTEEKTWEVQHQQGVEGCNRVNDRAIVRSTFAAISGGGCETASSRLWTSKL